jgi:chromosome segregation ATPase|tara:strand:- start:120 stop:557 length:438 start_codon:yes stop_codon:yes gene_type:complete
MAENGTTDIKIQLESLRKDIEAGNSIQGRLDTAIDKLTDVSTSIKSMLAVHEEKIQRQEQIDEIIFEKLKARQNEIDDLEVKLKDNIELSEKRLLCEIKTLKNSLGERVSTLEKYKWLILGGSIVVGWVLSKNFAYIMNMMNSAS